MKPFDEWLKENTSQSLVESNHVLHDDPKTGISIHHAPTEPTKIIVVKSGKTKTDQEATHHEWNSKDGIHTKPSTIAKGTTVAAHYDPVKNTTVLRHFDGKDNHTSSTLKGHFTDHID